MAKQILFYEGPGWYYSNFSAFEVTWNGWLCKTVEHGYQAYKFTDPVIQALVLGARSPHDAKKIARAHQDKVRPDWEEIKLPTMESLVRAKRDQHPFIRRMLKASGDGELIENSPKDYFWGCGKDGTGLGHLGKIWMKLRAEDA